MADPLSAGAQHLRPAFQPHVNHRQPIHDRFCRCRACKPPHVTATASYRRRVWIALVVMLILGWGLAAYGLMIWLLR